MLRSHAGQRARPGNWLARFSRSERGASGSEYAAILGMIGAVAVGGGILVGRNAQTAVQSAASSAGNATGSGGSGGAAGSGSGSATGRTVFADSFSSAKTSASNWDFNNADCKVHDNALYLGPSAANLVAYALNSTFTDGTIAFDATLNTGWGLGIMFHLSADPVKGAYNGYSFQYDEGYSTGAFLLRKIVNGVELDQPLIVNLTPAGYPWYGVNKHFELTTKGSLITAKIDGKVVLSFSDSSYTTGGVGLRAWSGPSVSIQNFNVTAN